MFFFVFFSCSLLSLSIIMTATYSHCGQNDMMLILGFCEGYYRRSVAIFQDRFPNCQVLNHKTIARIEKRFCEHRRCKRILCELWNVHFFQYDKSMHSRVIGFS